jgi:glutamine synthetase
MVPSSASISGPNIVLNTIVAETLSRIADRLEKAKDFNTEVEALCKEVVVNHKKVIFNGNGYSDEWVVEAEKRGLPNISSTVEAVSHLISEKSIAVFEKHCVLSKAELYSRFEINLEAYIKQINIEALTMIEMAKRQIVPTAIKFANELAASINAVKSTGVDADVSVQAELLKDVSSTLASFKKNIEKLEKVTAEAAEMHGDTYKQACAYRDEVFTAMGELRADGDKLETMVDAELWPMPTYADLLFNV